MPIEQDEFDSALEDAVAPKQEIEADLIMGGDDGDDLDASSADGDDLDASNADVVDDSPPPIDRAREAEFQLAQAVDVEQQWEAEAGRHEQAFKDAQAKFKEVRAKVMADEATDDDELAAQNAIFDARHTLDKSRDQLNNAKSWRASVESRPKLAPAQAAWLDANQQYNTDDRFQKQAQGVMRDLIATGMDPSHQNFYRKVDEKLREPTRMGNNRKTPGAPAVRASKADPRRSTNMSNAEKQFIRKLGRNPDDKRVAAQWAESKANTKRIAQERGQM